MVRAMWRRAQDSDLHTLRVAFICVLDFVCTKQLSFCFDDRVIHAAECVVHIRPDVCTITHRSYSQTCVSY